MKEKDLKKMLRAQAADILPDESLRGKIKRDLSIDGAAAGPEPERATADEFAYAPAGAGASTQRGGRRASRLVLPLAAAAVATLLAVSLTVFFLLNPFSPLPGPGGNKFSQIRTTDDFYAYGAASVGALLGGTDGAATATAAGVMSAAKAMNAAAAAPREELNGNGKNGSADLTDEQMATLNRYMPLAEELLSDGSIDHASAAVPAEFTETYAYGMAISYRDLTGAAVTYHMYYNETPLSEKTEDGETEAEYNIDGVLLVSGAAYPVTGERETESEDGESESELRFTAQTGENSYLRVQREEEQEEGETEQKFVYTTVQNGRETERVTLEYEAEDGETELKMTMRREGGRNDVLTFENRTADGVFELAARGTLGGKAVSFLVQIVTDADGNTVYRYVVGDSYHDFDRPDRHDDDDDDDDDDDRRWSL